MDAAVDFNEKLREQGVCMHPNLAVSGLRCAKRLVSENLPRHRTDPTVSPAAEPFHGGGSSR